MKNLLYIFLSIGIFIGLYIASTYNYLLFHILADGFSIVIACGIFMFAWNARHLMENDYLLLLGIAYLFVGVIDTVHTLAYTGMGLIKGYESNLTAQLWIAARYVQSLSILIAPLFLRRRLNTNYAFACYSLITVLVLASMFYWKIFPTAFIEGTGLTLFKKISEYIISCILLVSIYALFLKKDKFKPYVFRLLVSSFIITIGSELAFTFYVSVYGFPNLLGHFLKIIAFYLIYKATISAGLKEPYETIFRDLKLSENLFRSLAQSSSTGIYKTDRNGKCIYVNPVWCEMSGLSPEEAAGDGWINGLYPEDRELIFSAWNKMVGSKGKWGLEYRFQTVEGKITWVYGTVATLLDEKGGIVGYLGTNTDITERKKADEELQKAKDELEERVQERTAELESAVELLKHEISERIKAGKELKESLREKVMLLSEIHHRVRNNLQVISSLLSLQTDYIEDNKYIDMFNDSKNRIKSMALVHEKLYHSKDLANIDFIDYINSLANSLFAFYAANTRNISLKMGFEDVALGLDTAIPCALVINELLSNCLKHAFPENRKGEISISFNKSSVEGETAYDLVVGDNGIGMPESIDIRETNSLGLQLIMTLIEHQLRGTIDMDRTKGTIFRIHFKEISYEKRI